MKWEELTQEKRLLEAAHNLGYAMPTSVQEESWNGVLTGHDLCVRAQTGSGKTMAYLMPLFERFHDFADQSSTKQGFKKQNGINGNSNHSSGGIPGGGRENKILILVPTHELAMQVGEQARLLAEKSGILLQSVVIVGNVNISRQIEKLRAKPQIIIGTAGRVLELIKKKKIAAHLIRTVVLDEGDRLFDQHNKETTDAVIKCMLRDRQLLLYSASASQQALACMRAWSPKAELLIVKPKRYFSDQPQSSTIPKTIHHWYVVADPRYKLETLRGLVNAIRTRKAMIFINRPSDIEEAAEKLLYHHYPVDYIHGSRKKEERQKAIWNFRSGKMKYLLATDLAARGMDFEQIDTVFHVSIPETAQDYLHRAGRTGRRGEPGRNILIVSQKEVSRLHRFEKELGIQIEEKFYYDGKLQGEPPCRNKG